MHARKRLDHRGREVRAEVRTPASPEEVWQAWADPRHLERWFPDRASGEALEGATFTYWWDRFGLEIPYRVLAAEPGERPALHGELGGRTGILEVVIEKQGGETVIRLVNSGFRETDGWEDEYEGVASGWRDAQGLDRRRGRALPAGADRRRDADRPRARNHAHRGAAAMERNRRRAGVEGVRLRSGEPYDRPACHGVAARPRGRRGDGDEPGRRARPARGPGARHRSGGWASPIRSRDRRFGAATVRERKPPVIHASWDWNTAMASPARRPPIEWLPKSPL
jgi:uncharacterized protein YndB with AHSA1/START domain